MLRVVRENRLGGVEEARVPKAVFGDVFELLQPVVGEEDVVFEDEGVVEAELPDVLPEGEVASRARPLRWVEALLEWAVDFVVDLVRCDGRPSRARDAQPLQPRAHGGPAAVERDAKGVLSRKPEHLF